MKKSFIILLCLIMSYCVVAQEKTRQKEIGLTFDSFDNFGLVYRTGTNHNLWRFSTLVFTGNSMKQHLNNPIQESKDTNFGVKIGKEYRKSIIDNLELRYGADLSFNYNRSKLEYDDGDRLYKRTTYRPGFNLIFGFNYLLDNNFLIGVELLPGFSYTTGEAIDTVNGEETKYDLSGFNYGFNNNYALISLAYRFYKN